MSGRANQCVILLGDFNGELLAKLLAGEASGQPFLARPHLAKAAGRVLQNHADDLSEIGRGALRLLRVFV